MRVLFAILYIVGLCWAQTISLLGEPYKLKIYDGPPWLFEGQELIGPKDSSGWIGTEEEYEDFELTGEYWIDRGETHESNSGIFIRASRQGQPWIDGYELQISLQDEKNPTGSVYNRVPTSLELMKRLTPEKQWNKFAIRAEGARIRAWYNGEQVQDATLNVRSKGVIGFQQHHPGVTVRYRNLKIEPLPKPKDEWAPLFNGKDLTGWEAKGKAKWEVVDGVLRGSGEMGHLFSMASFKDFELRGMFKITPNGNSGFYFRARPPASNPDSWPEGLEAQIWNRGGDYSTGSLYGRVRAPEITTRDEAWFSMRVLAEGKRVRIYVNGRQTVDTQVEDFLEGRVAIQCHDPRSTIEARDVWIREIR